MPVFGTKYFGSLNTKVGPNNLKDTDLQVCTNVRRDTAGELQPAKYDLFQYSVQGIGYGLGVLTCAGLDKVLWATDDYVYENGTSIGNSGGDTTHRFLGDGTRRYVLNGVENKVWDGTNYRKHGPFSDHDLSSVSWLAGGVTVDIKTTTADKTVTGAVAATGVITCASHGMSTGDNVYCSSFAGGTWTTLNGNVYVVTVIDTSTFTLDGVDTAGLGAWSAGTIRPKVIGQAGTYKYCAALVVFMPSGQQVESKAYPLSFYTLDGAYIEGYPRSYAITKDMVVRVEGTKVYGDELDDYTDGVSTAISLTAAAFAAENPAKITTSAHGLSTGDYVYFYNVTGGGWTAISANSYAITVVDDDNFTLDGVDASGYGNADGGTCLPWRPMVKMRVYRTKAGGEDYWLCGDTIARGETYATPAYVSAYLAIYYDQCADNSLTTAYLDGLDDHSTPPTATMGVFCQQRLFLAGVSGYESRLYYSMIGNYDYFPPLNYIECGNTITALSRFMEHVMVCSPADIKLFSPVGEVGQLPDTQSPVGCEYPDSLCVTGFGTLFCRDDGLWLFDGVTSKRISEPIDSLWQAASGTWRGAYVAGHGYFTCGDDATAKAFEFYRTGDAIEWSTAPFGSTSSGYYWQSPYIALAADPGDAFLYGLSFDGYVAKLGKEVTTRSLTAKTKAFGNGPLQRWARIRIDADTAAALTVAVTTNRGVTTTITTPSTMSAQSRYDFPPTMLGEECEVTITGSPTTLRSIVLETA